MTFWVAGAVVVGGLASAAIGSSGAQSAANTQAQSAANAQGISQQEFNTITGQEQPFMQGGYGALSSLEYGLGIGGPGGQSITTPTMNGYDPSSGYRLGPGGSIQQLIPGGGTTSAPGASGTTPPGMGYGSLLQPFTAQTMQQYSPAYRFQLGQGMQGVLNGDASSSGALSGSAQKDLASFNQNYANTAFNNAFNQYQVQQGNIYSRLAGLTQLGQSAAANTGQQGTALAGQAAQSATNIGSALAAGQVGSANAWSGALSGMSYLPFLMGGGSTPGMASMSGY